MWQIFPKWLNQPVLRAGLPWRRLFCPPDPKPEIPAWTRFLPFKEHYFSHSPLTWMYNYPTERITFRIHLLHHLLVCSASRIDLYLFYSVEIRIGKERWFWQEVGGRLPDDLMPGTQSYALDSSPDAATHHLHVFGQLLQSPGLCFLTYNNVYLA